MAKNQEAILSERARLSDSKANLVSRYQLYVKNKNLTKGWDSAEEFVRNELPSYELQSCGFKTKREVIIYLSDQQPPLWWD